MINDPISDLLTRMRNALLAGKRAVEAPASKHKLSVLNVLLEEGYIERYEIKDVPEQHYQLVRIVLKYDKEGYPVIRKMKRVSRPGQRQFFGSDNLPRILNGAGIAIVSTSKGVMTDRAARRQGVGGELLCTVE
jgi:small subunit ribosomal protein S8